LGRFLFPKAIMANAILIGIDPGKRIFFVHPQDVHGQQIGQRKPRHRCHVSSGCVVMQIGNLSCGA
jgi:hypothetical protein